MSKPKPKSGTPVFNLPLHEIVAIAAYLAGADRKLVDTEDIAVKANEIAPGHFSWRKYKDQINLYKVYKHLWDLTKLEKGEYITGSEMDGWMLTLAGTSFAHETVEKLKDLKPARDNRPRKELAWMQRERARMLAEVAYLKVREGREAELTPTEAAKFFRLDDYVIGAARARKIQQAENAFHNDPELAPVISKIASIVRRMK